VAEVGASGIVARESRVEVLNVSVEVVEEVLQVASFGEISTTSKVPESCLPRSSRTI